MGFDNCTNIVPMYIVYICKNAVQILIKYRANIVQILCTYCTNFVKICAQILVKFCTIFSLKILLNYCINIVQISPKFCMILHFFVVANIVNIAQILCQYLQILKKYCPTQIFRKYFINIVQSYLSNIVQMI